MSRTTEDSEYKDLTPINNISNGEEYLNALEWALNNPKVKNIALAGPYGAGKSSIIETYLNIAVEYIVKNQAEFYNSLEDFPMTKNVLERLLFEQKIPMDNREELFEKYAKTYMTEKIALNMNAEGFKVTKTLFDIAWEILSENQKERLMIANLELLNVDDMEKCFGELSGQYSVLSERTKRCKVKLDNTENNRKLVNYLEKIGYITSSWEEKTDSNGQVIIIGCRIKQKR